MNGNSSCTVKSKETHQTSEDRIVKYICTYINKQNLNRNELLSLVSRLLFSIGSSLEDCVLGSAEEVLLRYSQNPTLGNALMAQALMMKETWVKERETND